MIPGFETERLVFRGQTLADFADSAAMWASPEVTRFIGGKPNTREESWARLCRNLGHWDLNGYGYWVVRERGGRFVGEVGFADWKREIVPPLDAPEAGWVLAPDQFGKGYGTEAVRGALAWAEKHFGHSRSVCIIDPGNEKSVRVAEKCGYARHGEGLYKGHPAMIYRRSY